MVGADKQMRRVDQNDMYTVYIRYSWQGFHKVYGCIRCIIRFWPTLQMSTDHHYQPGLEKEAGVALFQPMHSGGDLCAIFSARRECCFGCMHFSLRIRGRLQVRNQKKSGNRTSVQCFKLGLNSWGTGLGCSFRS